MVEPILIDISSHGHIIKWPNQWVILHYQVFAMSYNHIKVSIANGMMVGRETKAQTELQTAKCLSNLKYIVHLVVMSTELENQSLYSAWCRVGGPLDVYG